MINDIRKYSIRANLMRDKDTDTTEFNYEEKNRQGVIDKLKSRMEGIFAQQRNAQCNTELQGEDADHTLVAEFFSLTDKERIGEELTQDLNNKIMLIKNSFQSIINATVEVLNDQK